MTDKAAEVDVASCDHTPGPWTIHQTRKGAEVWIQSERGTVFDSGAPNEWPLSEANARLIAAAPDLLAACELLNKAQTESAVDEYSGTFWEALEVATEATLAAIHKATSASP